MASMHIQQILFISLFVLLSLVTITFASLAFFSIYSAFEEEISHNLSGDATTLMEEVDMLMFERLQNVHSWSRLDIVQEARIGDVDKRLSKFLADLNAGYQGMYRHLFYTDKNEKIIASSKPQLIGQSFKPTGEWLTAEIPNGQVFIEDLQFEPPYKEPNLIIRAPVTDNFSSAIMGQFYGLLDMTQIFRLLDDAEGSRSGERYIVLLDADGRNIAASSSLRSPEFLLKKTFADWIPDKTGRKHIHSGRPVVSANVLIGYAASKGYLGYERMGWSVLVFQSIDKAFLPIRALWIAFAFVILLVLFLALLSSFWISRRIAKPLLDLTQWIRQVQQLETAHPPKLEGPKEIRELEAAFADLLHELECSREQIIKAAKLAVIGEMAAIMAHEVRTPLGILFTSAQWLQREPALSPEGKEMAQFILDESVRLKKLVTSLLECATPRAPQISPVNIHELLTRAVKFLALQAEKKRLRIELQLEAANPVIGCDFELITQVFINLLLNAIQVLPDHGTIRIKTSSGADGVSIAIADDGPGIDENDFQHLFDPFFTKREGGIGLGLTVTQQIVKAHHGTLTASPSEWGGACFNVKLPTTS